MLALDTYLFSSFITKELYHIVQARAFVLLLLRGLPEPSI